MILVLTHTIESATQMYIRWCWYRTVLPVPMSALMLMLMLLVLVLVEPPPMSRD